MGTPQGTDALAQVDEVLDRLEVAEAIYVPSIALGEIRSGFLKGWRGTRISVRYRGWHVCEKPAYCTRARNDAPERTRFPSLPTMERAVCRGVKAGMLFEQARKVAGVADPDLRRDFFDASVRGEEQTLSTPDT